LEAQVIEALIAGKVYGKPERRTSKTGKPFTAAKVRAVAGDGEMQFINVVVFSDSAQAALLALADGDAVALAGHLTAKAWIDKEGTAKPNMSLVAQQVLTAYHAKRKRDAAGGP
jgi:single-stranded DNA-binding protein